MPSNLLVAGKELRQHREGIWSSAQHFHPLLGLYPVCCATAQGVLQCSSGMGGSNIEGCSR